MGEADVNVGDVLDAKYRVERILGAGGMGAVVLATHLDLNALRAVKYILPSGRGNQVLVERFLREARASIQLKSEHVVRVFDVGRFQSGEPYMVMEYLQGSDLDDLLKAHGSLPPETAVDYLLQAMEAIAEAHRRGIIHRDLKPANLFLAETESGAQVVKVLDFGISKLTGEMAAGQGMEMTKTATMMGSPYFMSPEQMRSTKDVDHRTDIWSLGVIAYQLLTNNLPFNGESITALCAAVFTEEAQPLSLPSGEALPGLSQAVMRCLAKNPNERYQSVAEFAAALAPYGGQNASYRLQRINAQAQHIATGTNPAPAAPVAQPPVATASAPEAAHATSDPSYASNASSASANTAGAFSQSMAGGDGAGRAKRTGLWIGLGFTALSATAIAAALLLGAGSEKDEGSAKRPDVPPVTTAATSTASPEADPAASNAAAPPVAGTTSPSATASASASASASTSPQDKPPKPPVRKRQRRRRVADPFGDGRH